MANPADCTGGAVEKIVETPPSPQVRFHPGWIGQVLSYPRCADAYLHHSKVEVFSRLEDEKNVSRTSVEGKFSCLDYLFNAEFGNPSPRRDGLPRNWGGPRDIEPIRQASREPWG
jgi:hypothetical protein